MGEIHKLTKNGITIYPASTTDAIVNPTTRTTLSDLINSYNISSLFPTSGSNNTSNYTLQGAISLLGNKLKDSQKIPGLRVVFTDIINHETQEWRYLGGVFTDTSNWSRVDSWYVKISEGISNLTDTPINYSLRDTRLNQNQQLGINTEYINWDSESNLDYYKTLGIYIIEDASRYNNLDNLPLIGKIENFSAILTVTTSLMTVGQELLIVNSQNSKTEKYTRSFNYKDDSWSKWYKLSSIIELGNIEFIHLNNIIESGSYSGYINNFPNKENNLLFRLDVINNQTSISQIIYLSDSNPKIRFYNTEWSDFSEVLTEDKIRSYLKDSEKKFEEHLEILNLEGKQGDFCVASWDPNDLKPECDEIYGNPDFCNDWDFYLIDTTDNTGETTTPVGKLKKNNLLRFEDGSFAPVIGITKEREAECSVDLYLEDGYQICESGKFNPTTFYEKYGVNTKLYNSNKQEVNILRPWETTETKYTIGIGRDKTIYLLDNVLGNSGKRWKGIFSKPVIWDGIDVSKFEIKPTVISLSPCTVIEDTDKGYCGRCFYYTYTTCDKSKGSKGKNIDFGIFYNNKSYPINNISSKLSADIARNINAEFKSVPFAEGSYLLYNSLITSFEVYNKTKNLLGSKFSSGICYEKINNENEWKTRGGIRYKKSEEDNDHWEYQSWGDNIQSNGYYKKDSSFKEDKEFSTWSYIVNNAYPKEVCMESQMVLSFANELGILENTEFDFYGNVFWYKNINTENFSAEIFKKVTNKINLYNSKDKLLEFDIEIILRTGLIKGTNFAGDTFICCNGGYELVETVEGFNNYSLKIYIEPDQSNWEYCIENSKINYEKFCFEKNYKLLTEKRKILRKTGFVNKRIPYTNIPLEQGTDIYSGECCFNWELNTVNVKRNLGDKCRINNFIGYNCIRNNRGLRSGYHCGTITQQIPDSTTLIQARINTEPKYLLRD